MFIGHTMSFISVPPEFSDYFVDFFHLHIVVVHDSPEIKINYASSRENMSAGFLTRSVTNWSVQPQEMARGLKFSI